MDGRDCEEVLDDNAATMRRQRTRARWKKLRAATLVFLLYRRRQHHASPRPSHRQQPHKRTPTSVFFAKPSVQAATAAAAQRLANSQPPGARWFTQKLQLFERLVRKPMQSRDDVDIKLLGEFIRQTRFVQDLSSASIDTLAQVMQFRSCHEGEILHLQGSEVLDTSGRYLVVSGSLLVYKNAQFALRAREGEDYMEWYLLNTPGATREAVRYGDCIETCSIGDITGDDATLEYLFREHSVISQVNTVIAYVTQADYKRVIRFNVDNEPQLLAAVREILTPPKVRRQSLHQVGTKEPTQGASAARPELSRHQVRMLMRFLQRFKCFRVLPHQFCMDIVSKLQLSTVNSDEVLCASSDGQPSMVMMLDGKLCVHVHQSHEWQHLKARDDARTDSRSRPTPKAPDTAQYLPGCEAGSTVEASIGARSLHICSLIAGDSFGELAISSGESTIQGASIYHPFTTSGQMTATVVRISRHDYVTVLQRYIETGDFNFAAVCAILTRSLPQDRTDEQVQYMKTFFLRRSSARLLFRQLPSRVMDCLLLSAGIESQAIGEDIDEFIQKEGSTVTSMKIVLNGYVGVFKDNSNALAVPTGKPVQDLAPKRAVLRRYQSRLIRANTHILDTSGGKQSGRRASIHRNPEGLPNAVLPELDEGGKYEAGIDPISVLPSGAAFGHVQVLTGQPKSPYSYAAFASGSGVLDDSSGVATETDQCVHLLSIPARFVLLYLSSLDRSILYNPTRAFKRLQHENKLQGRSQADAAATVRRLQLPLVLTRNKALVAVPKNVASSMIEDMAIIAVETRRVIYEVGGPVRPVLFVVLSGSVRVFSYASKAKGGKDRRGSLLPGSDEKRPKLPRRISQEAPEPRQDEMGACVESSYSFSKPATDSIFLSDYNQTTELVCGDIFGWNEHHTFATNRSPSSPIRPPKPLTLHVESAVSMTECLLGVVTRQERPCGLSIDDRRLLIRVIDDGDDVENSRTDRMDDDVDTPVRTFDSLATPFQVLEAMNLSHRLPTLARMHLATRLKYLRLTRGETVFKQGELSEAIYFVLFGSVTLYIDGQDDSIDARTRGFTGSDHRTACIDVVEGEVFGEEVYESSHGCTRRFTAVATGEENQHTVLVYLFRLDLELVVDGNMNVAYSPRQVESKKETALRLLNIGQQKVSAKERWKMAIHQVIQLRAQRSRWPTVLMKARNHRIDLLYDLIKDLPAFESTPSSVAKNLCRNAVLQTFAQDTMVFTKGEVGVNACFLVVQGSVTLFQTYYGSGSANDDSSTTPGLNPQSDNAAVRVTIRQLEPGDIFGEFEIFEDRPRRHISAIVGTPGTKIVTMQHDDFLADWPKREKSEHKLEMLKSQLRNLCRLDTDQLCSLYYGMRERTFRRNEVIIGNKEHDGYLHVIQDGMCVVHDAVVLKQKKSVLPSRSPTKLSLDTRVSTLGPGAILFGDLQDLPTLGENRRASSRSLDLVESLSPADPSPTTQYVVVDSPTMTTYCVQLFPRRMSSSQRQPDLLVVLLLGKNGLHVIHDTVKMQLKWRAENVAQTGLLVANSFSQSADRVSEYAQGSVDVELELRPRMGKPMMQKDITKALLRYDFAKEAAGPAESLHKPLPPSARQGLNRPCGPPLQSPTFGSFSPRSRHQITHVTARERASGSASPPILPSLASCSTMAYTQVPVSPRLPRYDASSKLAYGPDEQLRKEESVLVSLPKPVPRQDVLTKMRQQEMRRRHGRPPPKRVENSGEFVDEHAVVPSALLKDEHERKKASLCRRLLHVKGSTQL